MITSCYCLVATSGNATRTSAKSSKSTGTRIQSSEHEGKRRGPLPSGFHWVRLGRALPLGFSPLG